MKAIKVKKVRKFSGKSYKYYKYTAMKSEANDIIKSLKERKISARIVSQPGAFGGWNIYVRRKRR